MIKPGRRSMNGMGDVYETGIKQQPSLCRWAGAGSNLCEYIYVHRYIDTVLLTSVSLKDCKNGFSLVEGGKDHSHPFPPPKKEKREKGKNKSYCGPRAKTPLFIFYI